MVQTLERGLNRFKQHEIEEDNQNQTKARFDLMNLLNVNIETMEMMSPWDWEFFRDGKILAIGEYRRRFCKFGTFPDFQFGKKKFDAMLQKGKEHGIPAYMFVEFDDVFLYFPLVGSPITKTMRRNHEVRTEECVCIPNNEFENLYQLSM
jgi:hypothetical protein